MAQTIDIPGQGLVDFPDEMSPDQIKGVIKQKFFSQPAAPPSQPTPEQTPAFAQQFGVGAAPEAAGKETFAYPGDQAGTTTSEEIAKPLRAIGQTAVELVKGLPSLAKLLQPPSVEDVIKSGAAVASQGLTVANSKPFSQEWWNAVVPLTAQVGMAAAAGRAGDLPVERPPVQGGLTDTLFPKPVETVAQEIQPATQAAPAAENAVDRLETQAPQVSPVVAAATRDHEGRIFTGTNHAQTVEMANQAGGRVLTANDNGFVDANGNYLTKQEATRRVNDINQFKLEPGERAFSEDQPLEGNLLNQFNEMVAPTSETPAPPAAVEPVAAPVQAPAGAGEAQAPKIVGAAIQDASTGKTFTGPSHPQIYNKFPQIEGDPGEAFTGEGWNTGGNYIDGFVDQNGKFYDREEAASLAGLPNEASMTELETVAGKIPDAPYKIIKPTTGGEPTNAIQPSNAQVESGTTAQRVEAGAAGQVPSPGSSDNALREAQGSGEQGTLPGTETQTERGQPTPAEVAAEPVTLKPPEEGGRTTGIAQRITNVPAGETMSTQEFADRGRTLIDQGANPAAVSANIKSTKEISSDSLSVLRAHEENLTKRVYQTGDLAAAHPNDPAYQQDFQDALKARNDWRSNDVKPAQTIWAELGHGQQGETDIDTGTVTGLRMAFMDVKGRDATPVEQTRLAKIAGETQQVEAKVDQAKSRYDEAITKVAGPRAPVTADNLQQTFADRVASGKKFDLSQPEIADLWKYAKDNYIDKGVTSLDDTIHGIALDTGLKPDQVAEALTKPKAINRVTNDLYKQMSDRRNIVNAAKDYINARDEPTWKRVARAVWETPFSLAIYGHGTVGGITHAGANIFKPSAWGSYWPDFVNQAKFFAKPSIHEAAMQTLVRDPNFVTAKRAGLANDPNLTYTDYGAYAKFFGLQGGRRGFDALKTMRQSMFNDIWKGVPDSIKSDPAAAKDMAKNYAEMVNHSTGVISKGDRGFLASAARAGSPVMFAAKLEASRWARIIGDPVKTLNTFADWNGATAGERAVALRRTRNAAEFGAVFLGSLYANQAILSASGSKEKINFSDPSKSDWLKHKVAGHVVAVDGGLLSPIRLLGRVVYDTLVRPRKELRGDTRTTAAIKDVGQYALGKASPSVGIAKEAFTAETFDGRLLPWSRDTSKKPKMTWTEYAASHGPIPLSGGIKEAYDSMRERGMSGPDAETFLRGLAAFGSELTGARVTQAPEERPQTAKKSTRKSSQFEFKP